MKTNSRQGPDFESIISGFPPAKATKDPTPQSNSENKHDTPREISEHPGRLWKEFLEVLNEPEDEPDSGKSKKLYCIDEDIVETLHQCDFGKPNVQVINSILRVFLIDNITRLRELHRPRSLSLLDKYE